MPFPEELAVATLSALDRIQQPGLAAHSTLYLKGVIRLIHALSERLFHDEDEIDEAPAVGRSLTTSEYEDLVATFLEGDDSTLGAEYRHRDDIPRVLMGRFPVLTLDDRRALYRPSRRDEMPSPAMVEGEKVLGSRDKKQRHMSLAHNYLCQFPEALPVLAMYAPPAALNVTAAAVLTNRWEMFRRLNSVRVTLVVNELRDLELLEAAGQGYRAVPRQPAPMIAYALTKSYLQVSQYAVGVGVTKERLEALLRTRLSPPSVTLALRGTWAEVLGRPGGGLSVELGGGQFRLQPENLIWLAGLGLVDPVDVGRVLRQQRATKALKALREAFQSHAQGCVNEAEFLSELSPC